MPLDPHAPVLVGSGQLNRRREEPELAPLELMARAAGRAAEAPGGERLLGRVESVRVVDCLSWPVPDPGALLAAELGLRPAQTVRTSTSGTGPLDLLADACAEIQAGRLDVALIVGAEAILPFMRASREGRASGWAEQPADAAPDLLLGDGRAASHEVELGAGLLAPVHYYPWFENALRIAARRTPAEHRDGLAKLWRRFAEVAESNPHAWVRRGPTEEEIRATGEGNRMVADPYSKLTTANIQVDQGAAVLLCGARAAASAGIEPERRVYVHATAAAHDHWFAGSRQRLHRSPAIAACGRASLGRAGVGIDDVAQLDLYSCFPSAVRIAAAELGIDLDGDRRPPTVTGGLTFAGGPGSNYVTHALATMTERLRGEPGAFGFLTGVGWYMTKHANAVLSTRPPARPYAHAEPQAEVDALPSRKIVAASAIEGPVESCTVVYERDGTPSRGIAGFLRSDGSRALAATAEPAAIRSLLDGTAAG